MHYVKDSKFVNKTGVAIVGSFRIPVIVTNEVFSHGKTKYFCKPTAPGVSGGAYIDATHVFFGDTSVLE